MDRTDQKIDTPVTHPRSLAVRDLDRQRRREKDPRRKEQILLLMEMLRNDRPAAVIRRQLDVMAR